VSAVAVAGLVEEGVLDLDAPLDQVLPGLGCLEGGVTARHVLTHTAGLHTTSAMELEMLSPERRLDHLQKVRRPTGWRLGHEAAYSEQVGWTVLGMAVEAVGGESLRTALRQRVLDPLGLADTWIGMTGADHVRVHDRLGVNVDLRKDASFPLLWERSPAACLHANAAHGGYSTATDLARFYAALLERLGGSGPTALPSSSTLADFTAPARGPMWDPVLERECDYGLGFMVDLPNHHFGRTPSASAFGHSGIVGSSFAWADPERRLAVGVVVNGITDPETSFMRRPALIRAMTEDIEDVVGPREDQPAGEPRPPRWWRRRS
jgi:CubicO group peptidase (beta-lactamase class C family)